jgi:hypothetical protein
MSGFSASAGVALRATPADCAGVRLAPRGAARNARLVIIVLPPELIKGGGNEPFMEWARDRPCAASASQVGEDSLRDGVGLLG